MSDIPAINRDRTSRGPQKTARILTNKEKELLMFLGLSRA